jgi:GNAT superfamily N-acetyltransferase
LSAAGVRLSPLDSARWQVPTAKAAGVTAQGLPAALAFCRSHRVGFLVARCAADDLAAAQAMEREGFALMDTLVYFSRKLAAETPEDSSGVSTRELREGEGGAVEEIARQAFSGYLGHYHSDPRLDRRQCDEVYIDWARRTCASADPAEGVLVAAAEGRIVAFATMRLNSGDEGEGVLFGVAPAAQGRGIYRSLMIAGMSWCAQRGRSRMVVSTQVTNVAVQKVWTRVGFEPSAAQYTFHKWF